MTLTRRAFVLLVLCAAACSGGVDEPRPLSQPEAERLAMARFLNHEAGVVAFTATLPLPGAPVRLDGRVDFARHVGIAATHTEGADVGAGLVRWTPTALAFRPGHDLDPAAPLPQDGWTARMLDKAHSELDALLILLPNLALDRPENAMLIRQGGSTWLGAATLRGVEVDILEGPRPPGPRAAPGSGARLRYWITADGTPLRVEARLGTLTEFAVIDLLHDAPAPPIPPLLRTGGR